MTAWSRDAKGNFGMHVTPFSKSFLKRLTWITKCASINEFWLWNFFYWKYRNYKYFVEVLSIHIPIKKGDLWTYQVLKLDSPRCYYLGSWPLHWDPINRQAFAPNLFGNPGSYSIAGGPTIPGEYVPDVHEELLEDCFKKYGDAKMHAWSDITKLPPVEKKKFMEDQEQPDGTWKPSIYSQIEADVSGLLIAYKRAELEAFVEQKWYLKSIDIKFADCAKREYPEQKKTTYEPPTPKDFLKPVSDLELPEPERSPAPAGHPQELVYVLNMLFYTVENRAFGTSFNLFIKAK